MLTSSELKKIPIFACLNDANLVWLSQQAADLHLEPGEYLIHEGEPTPFFVVMEGTTEVLKDVMGRQTEVSEHKPGDFFGELAILMASAAPASVRAKTACHLARLDPQHLQELIRRSPECSALILQTLNERVQAVQKYMLNLPSSRVQIVGSKFDTTAESATSFDRAKDTLLTRMLAIGALEKVVDRMIVSLQLAPETRRRKPELGAELSRNFRSWNRRGVINTVRSVLVDRDSTLDALCCVKAPALVVSGKEDTILPSSHSRRIAEHLPKARNVEVPGAAHLVPLEAPEASNALILEFFADLPQV
jgi:CRP-like cAMP-binding protein